MRWRYIAIQIIRTNAYSIIKYVFACRGVIDCHFSKKLIGLYFPEFTQIEFIIIWSPLRIQHQPISSIVKVPSAQVKIDNYIFRFKIYINRRIGFFFRLLFSVPKLPHFKWICSEMMIHFFSSILSILQLLLSWSFNTYVIFWIIVAVALIPMLLPIRSTDTVSAWMKAIRITCTVCIDYIKSTYKINGHNQSSFYYHHKPYFGILQDHLTTSNMD